MFARWLDDRLQVLRISNGALAKRVGVSTGAVWAWRTGEYPPAIKHIPLLAAAIGVSEFEVYCAIRGLPYEDMSDGRLAAMIGITEPNEDMANMRLLALVYGAVKQWRHELEAGLLADGDSAPGADAPQAQPPNRSSMSQRTTTPTPAAPGRASRTVSVAVGRAVTQREAAASGGAGRKRRHSPQVEVPQTPPRTRNLG